jgi:hypothetical protein
MRVTDSKTLCNPTSDVPKTTEQTVITIDSAVAELKQAVADAVQQGSAFDLVERRVSDLVRRMGKAALDMLLLLQGMATWEALC